MSTYFADGSAIVLAEVGNGLVVGYKPTRQPHHLNVAPGLVLKPPARLHPIEIAVNVKLQQHRGMIRGSAGCLGSDPTKPKFGQIEFVDIDIDHANRIVLADPVFQAFRKKCALTAIRPLNKAPHPILLQIAPESYRENQSYRCVFTQAGSLGDVALSPCDVCFTPQGGHFSALQQMAASAALDMAHGVSGLTDAF